MARLIPILSENLKDFKFDQYCRQLEDGNILFFPQCPFDFPEEELKFLLAQKQTGASHRKNISYKPDQDKITNFEKTSEDQEKLILNAMRNYSHRATLFLTQLLAPYSKDWKLDYASFRPFQEKGRPLRLHARNDLLHVDAFPTRPVHGGRILRFFTNINPTESRFWITSDPFEKLLEDHLISGKIKLPRGVDDSILSKLFKSFKKIAYQIGLPVHLRSPYDTFMHQFHNYLKENESFQKSCRKDYWEFPPNSCWAVFTDQVSHAAISGQYALEQTYIIPKRALIDPCKAPVAVLESKVNHPMVDWGLLV